MERTQGDLRILVTHRHIFLRFPAPALRTFRGKESRGKRHNLFLFNPPAIPSEKNLAAAFADKHSLLECRCNHKSNSPWLIPLQPKHFYVKVLHILFGRNFLQLIKQRHLLLLRIFITQFPIKSKFPESIIAYQKISSPYLIPAISVLDTYHCRT